jgi:hypothetical protein
MPTTHRRIDAESVETTTTTTTTRTQTRAQCPQCGMFTHFTDHPTAPGNRQQRSGETRCYGCQFANVSLSGRKHAGISFDEFMAMKNHVDRVRGII